MGPLKIFSLKILHTISARTRKQKETLKNVKVNYIGEQFYL